MLAKDYLSGLNPVYWQFWLGILLIVVVLFGRGGILAAARHFGCSGGAHDADRSH